MCPDIPDPGKGQIDFVPDDTAPFSLGTNATYSCDDGYSLVTTEPGPLINPRMCTGDGSSNTGYWTGSPLDCILAAPLVGGRSYTALCMCVCILLLSHSTLQTLDFPSHQTVNLALVQKKTQPS